MSGPFPPPEANIRRALSKMENDGHRKGWGRSPAVYRLIQRSDEGYLTLSRDGRLTRMLRGGAKRLRGDVSEALSVIATRAARTDETSGAMNLLCGLGPDDRVYGFALRNEEPGKWWGSSGQVSDVVNATEMRLVWMVTRDGSCWKVLRVRDQEPRVMAIAPDGDTATESSILNALGRLVAAVVNNPVPVPDLGATDRINNDYP